MDTWHLRQRDADRHKSGSDDENENKSWFIDNGLKFLLRIDMILYLKYFCDFTQHAFFIYFISRNPWSVPDPLPSTFKSSLSVDWITTVRYSEILPPSHSRAFPKSWKGRVEASLKNLFKIALKLYPWTLWDLIRNTSSNLYIRSDNWTIADSSHIIPEPLSSTTKPFPNQPRTVTEHHKN